MIFVCGSSQREDGKGQQQQKKKMIYHRFRIRIFTLHSVLSYRFGVHPGVCEEWIHLSETESESNRLFRLVIMRYNAKRPKSILFSMLDV